MEFVRDLQVGRLCHDTLRLDGLIVFCVANIWRHDRIFLRPIWRHYYYRIVESTGPTSKALPRDAGLFYGSCSWKVGKGVW